jgi:O-antigen/teichoic acid export membrane protein
VIEAKKLLTFSWPLFFVGFFYLIILWLNTLLVGFFMESRDVGIFGAAHNTAMLGQVVLIAFVSIFAPMVSDLHNRKQMEKLEHLFKIVTKWIFLFSFPIFVLMVYYAEEILALTFGKDFVVGARCLEILSLGLLINSLIASSGILTSMSGRPKLELYNLTAILVINVLLSFILIPRYGIIGAAYSTLIAFVSLNILRLLEVYYLFKIHPFRFDLYKPFLSGCSSFLIMVLAAKYLFAAANTFLSLVLGACVYIGLYVLILFLFGFEEEDKIILSKIREKVQLF